MSLLIWLRLWLAEKLVGELPFVMNVTVKGGGLKTSPKAPGGLIKNNVFDGCEVSTGSGFSCGGPPHVDLSGVMSSMAADAVDDALK